MLTQKVLSWPLMFWANTRSTGTGKQVIQSFLAAANERGRHTRYM